MVTTANTKSQRIALELKLKPLVMAKAKANLKTSTGGKNPQPLTDLSKAASDKKHNTRKAVAKSSGYSEGTVQNVETALDSAIDEVKADMLAGKVKINKAFNHHQLVSGRDDAAELLEWAAKSEAMLTADAASHRWQ